MENARHRRRGALLGGPGALLLAAIVFAMVTGACARVVEVPDLERRAQQLNRVLMCPVCPGESIDQSQNPLAAQMRAIVVEKLEQGWSEDQIKAFFVERFGPSVLLEPPRRGFSLLVWVVPPVAILGAASALYLVLRLMRRPPASRRRGPEEAPSLSAEEQARYFSRIEAALGDEAGRNTPLVRGQSTGNEDVNPAVGASKPKERPIGGKGLG